MGKLFEQEEHEKLSTAARLIRWLAAHNPPEDAVIVVAKSAVDEEFVQLLDFNTSELFPSGEILGYKVKVGTDFTLQDPSGNPLVATPQDKE